MNLLPLSNCYPHDSLEYVKVSEQTDAESVIEMMMVMMMMMTVMMIMMITTMTLTMVGMILVVIELTGIGCEFINRIHVAQVKVKIKVKFWAPTNKVMKIRIQ
jgi:hypothetical protein